MSPLYMSAGLYFTVPFRVCYCFFLWPFYTFLTPKNTNERNVCMYVCLCVSMWRFGWIDFSISKYRPIFLKFDTCIDEFYTIAFFFYLFFLNSIFFGFCGTRFLRLKIKKRRLYIRVINGFISNYALIFLNHYATDAAKIVVKFRNFQFLWDFWDIGNLPYILKIL